MRSHEMNLLDFCKAILRGLYRAAAWVVSRFGDMIRLTYRRWWIVLLVVLLCVTAALYYARTSNRMYEVNAVATLNGVTNEMVRHAFEALDKVNPSFTQQNPATMLGIEEELAGALSRFKAYDVIDLLADSTVDVIDYRGRVSRMDTLCVHMPHMVALQFRTKLPNRLAEVEEAVLQYLNTRPYFQALYASYHAGLVREARFHRDQVDKLDSLTSVFYTAKGRPVRDGGGITPDVKIEEPELPTLMFYLMTDFIVTDFVAEWSQKHKKIASPEEFVVTDEDFEAFKQYAKAKNFTYDRQSEKILKNLKEVAKMEGFLDQDSTLFKTLEAKLIPDLERDFDRNKERIKKVLASEIMKRYYYQKGELIQSLRDDKVLEKALEVLNDPTLYEKTLSAPVGI